ncbi:MAG: hypothetical protein I3273_07710 [Candidatus Moeniiplasma glomeromycotorum]|nr:hypothetical protein [Candidatus Moeniiplasma glomeromycotorum]MCE8168421.1 hypothetical protein [Candidatus Moeniiplasma glomeromycotorum]MCE8169966.1 hypothetical protein [Candidatus Moeniiplasma glomeromycotorum]
MNNKELKSELKTLLNENQETFVETLNEVFAGEWLNDQEDDLLLLNVYSFNWAALLKNRINKEIGEKYTKNPSKLALLLSAFAEEEIISKSTSKEKQQEFENNPKVLDGLKEIVKVFDKEKGEEW